MWTLFGLALYLIMGVYVLCSTPMTGQREGYPGWSKTQILSQEMRLRLFPVPKKDWGTTRIILLVIIPVSLLLVVQICIWPLMIVIGKAIIKDGQHYAGDRF